MDFDEKILVQRIITDNSWWETSSIPFYKNFSKRKYYADFNALIRHDAWISLHRINDTYACAYFIGLSQSIEAIF